MGEHEVSPETASAPEHAGRSQLEGASHDLEPDHDAVSPQPGNSPSSIGGARLEGEVGRDGRVGQVAPGQRTSTSDVGTQENEGEADGQTAPESGRRWRGLFRRGGSG